MTDIIQNKAATKRPRNMARGLKAQGTVEFPTSIATSVLDPKPAKPASKSNLVLTMLQRSEGATIVQLVAATDWLPHTTRAALTGLKKKGHEVTSGKAEGEERVYRVAVA